LLVFTEGGSSTISSTAAYDGMFHNNSDDISFWKHMFETFRPTIKVEFRALGSKSPLKEISEDIVNNKISGICTVMDRDYDCLFCKPVRHNNILYTRGYSWENEVFHASSISASFYRFTNSNMSSQKIKKEISNCIKYIIFNLRRSTIIADILLCNIGKPLFSRNNSRNVFYFPNKSSKPTVNRKKLRRDISSRKGGLGKFFCISRNLKIDVQKDCYGKLLMNGAVHILQHMLKKYGFPNLHRNYCENALITSFLSWVSDHKGASISRFYSTRISNVVI
jgi:hypothetical protein